MTRQIVENDTTFGKYRIVRRIGRGGAGEVYLARHCTLESDYALKVLKPEVAEDNPEFVARFLREGRLSAQIRHPNLIAVHDAGREELSGLYYIVMDVVSGGSLRDLLRRSTRLPPIRALNIVRQVACALEAGAKVGLVHRDIKPENIMFAEDGHVLLADLGIAKSSEGEQDGMTMVNAVFGTPAYMSPEQARDSSSVDGRSDLFSLGIVLYEMLAGVRPYANASPAELLARIASSDSVPALPPGAALKPAAQLVAALCEKDISRRIQSATELIVQIDRCLADPEMVDPADEQVTKIATGKMPVAPGRENRRIAESMLDEQTRRLLIVLLAVLAALGGLLFLLSDSGCSASTEHRHDAIEQGRSMYE